MFNQDERDQERGENEGLFAAVPNDDRDEPQNDEYREPEPTPEPEQTEPGPGEVQVRYVGPGGSYTDKDGTRYKKNEDVVVDEETAKQLESVRGGTLFVRTAG